MGNYTVVFNYAFGDCEPFKPFCYLMISDAEVELKVNGHTTTDVTCEAHEFSTVYLKNIYREVEPN